MENRSPDEVHVTKLGCMKFVVPFLLILVCSVRAFKDMHNYGIFSFHILTDIKGNMIYKSQWSSLDYNNHIFYADRNGSTL